MATPEQISELKIRGDIDHAFFVHSVENLEIKTEILEGLETINDLTKQFRDSHVELKTILGVEKYSELYADYDQENKKLLDYIVAAKKRLRMFETPSEEEQVKKKTAHNEEQLYMYFQAEELLDLKISQFEKSFDIKTFHQVEIIDEYLNRMEGFLNEYYEISKNLKYCLGDKFEKEYGPKFESKTREIWDEIKMAKLLKGKVLEVSEGRKFDDSNIVSQKNSDVRAKNLSSEINLRSEFLEKEYSKELENLSDYQILEISQNRRFDTEFNCVLEKVTAMGLLVEKGTEEAQKLFDMALENRNLLALKRELFLEKLEGILIERDITPDKLRNASTLKIEIPKFSGYNCSIDFYTFKSEFKKLIEPTVQKVYWADYLKMNYLSGVALTLVEKENDYGKIWEKLMYSFGNVRLLLQNKLEKLDSIGELWTLTGEEKIISALGKLINCMKDLSTLATYHKIEGQLYEGGGLEKVLSLIGYFRHRKFRTENLETSSKKEEWYKLQTFLEHELKIREKIMLDQKSSKLMGIEMNRTKEKKDKDRERKWPKSTNYGISEKKCHFCDGVGHTIITTAKGNKIIPYYVCEQFVNMTPKDRLTKLESKKLCTKCLYPGAVVGQKHKCFYLRYCCTNPSHNSAKIHVLLCETHKNDSSNIKLCSQFKDKFIENCPTTLPQFSKNISCFNMVGISTSTVQATNNFEDYPIETEIDKSGIFKLQTIEFDGIKLNLFYDSGCGDMIVRKEALEKLLALGRAKQVVPGPIILSGVGDQKTVCEDGAYSICLPLHNNLNAVLTGLCIPKITTEFPKYELNIVENEIKAKCKSVSPDLIYRLPKLPKSVGGDTDILIGAKYNKYFPKSIFKLDTGLEIFESVFISSDGSRGVVSGPHNEFSKSEENCQGMHVNKLAYTSGIFNETVGEIRKFSKTNDEIPVLGMKALSYINDFFENDNEINTTEAMSNVCVGKRTPKCVKIFDNLEKSGTEVSFRCVDCRECQKCKKGAQIESVSIQEEIEQDLIERNVFVDPEKGITSCKLPFLLEPESRLSPNKQDALKVFKQQCRKLTANPVDKVSVIEFQQKLQDLGFVDFLSNLSDDVKSSIFGNKVVYFIPWRAVWNEGSVTTGCRMVFDASQAVKGGCSLNSLLPKGVNGMNKLVEILIRWSTWKHAFHTDISKMYNAVRLDKSHWKYQLYLWNDTLNENDEPQWKVIKTVIYGVRPSGNIAECALRRTAEISRTEFPKACDVIIHDTYVDDCMSGTESLEKTLQLTDEMQATLAKGGFTLKGFAMSDETPPENMSANGESVLVGGLKWYPKGDFISLNIKELNFNKKIRGKKSNMNLGLIPEILTKRACVSKVSEIFDPTGRISPITAGLKLDVSILHERLSDWDDPLPNTLKDIWVRNFDLMREIKDLRFYRAVIPEDAVSLDCETIETADASENLICAAIYVRYMRRNGEHSCQLIFSRTKIIHNHTIPRAELAAALLNASTGHIVQLSLKNMVKKSWKLSDSQVALHWLKCTKSGLKIWVRSRVIEILRLTNDHSEWYHTSSKNMIADLGTRKGAKIGDVEAKSCWALGLPWMRKNEPEFPIVKSRDIILSKSEEVEANKETPNLEYHESVRSLVTKYVPDRVGARYQFSKYLIDPNKFRFRTVIRIMALTLLFLSKISKNIKKLNCLEQLNLFEESDAPSKSTYFVTLIKPPSKLFVVHLTQNFLEAARNYFFKKTTLELKHFVDTKKYETISSMKDEILYYSSRILPSQKISGKLSLSDVCFDLDANSFIVPIVDALSPVAYAIVLETHWFHPDVAHGGVESVLRFSQTKAYIIGGRELVKSIKKGCTKCRILEKKSIEIAMGPIGENNLQIAPPFHWTQVDICGPFNAYSPVNKRATLKIYYVVFCCTVTSAVDCRVMENYSADAFIAAFVRFSCRFGYPKVLFPDEGSQLVKGCKDMTISFTDVKNKLEVEYGMEYRTCPVGAHNVHGKVERKIKEIKRSLNKVLEKQRLSLIQWETLGQQIANTINNLPIGLGNRSDMLEYADVLTPNRLILGRNNNRCPTAPLVLKNDVRRIIQNNNAIFEQWFKQWLISYVPKLIEQPKWFHTERNICVGDIVLFLKSEQEFDRLYQYGVVTKTVEGRDGVVRVVEVEYQNSGEKSKRTTRRGARELVVIHPIDEIGILTELHELNNE